MKYSLFNTIIPYNNKFALYNSLENKVIFLEPELSNLFKSELKNINDLKQQHPEFYAYLLEHKFIISDSCNEIAKIKSISAETDNDKETFLLTINPTVNCNFKCWYCYETHIKQSCMTSAMVENVKKLITSILQDSGLKYLHLSFFGGEPLLYFQKNVVPLIDFAVNEAAIYDKSYTIGFTTNGYLINDRFIAYFEKKQINPHFQITLDGYRDNHNKVRFASKTKGSYLTIIENIKKLICSNCFVRLRINYTDENLHDAYKIADDFKDIDKTILNDFLIIDFYRVWQNQKIDELDIVLDKNIQIFYKKGFNVSNKRYNSVRESCYADKRNSAVINYNGDVFKCTARDFKPENREGSLDENGSIIWENNSLERRMQTKFNNQPCLSCRLLPVCNGGYSQHALENLGKRKFCVNSFDNNEKEKIIKAKIDAIVREYETK